MRICLFKIINFSIISILLSCGVFAETKPERDVDFDKDLYEFRKFLASYHNKFAEIYSKTLKEVEGQNDTSKAVLVYQQDQMLSIMEYSNTYVNYCGFLVYEITIANQSRKNPYVYGLLEEHLKTFAESKELYTGFLKQRIRTADNFRMNQIMFELRDLINEFYAGLKKHEKKFKEKGSNLCEEFLNNVLKECCDLNEKASKKENQEKLERKQ